jgi:uncharacterized spore protein YtfJ
MVCLSFVISATVIAQTEENVIDASVRTAVEELKGMYSAEIIMGTPLEVNGLKIIPLATVGVGYGQHGMPSDTQKMQGAGGILNPVGIIVVSGKNVKLIQLSKGFIEQLVGALAPVIVQAVRLGQQQAVGANGETYKIPETQGKTGTERTLISVYTQIVFYFILGWLPLVLIIVAFLPQQVTAAVSMLQQNYIRTGLIGLVGYGVAFLLTAVFTLSLIGIPLTFVVVILTCVFTLLGTVGLALVAGQKIAAALGKGTYSDIICVLIGGTILGIVGIVPVLGLIVWTIVVIFGFGSVLQIQWDKAKQKQE